MKNKKEALRLKRHRRIRTRLSGTPERPRLLIHRSLKNIAAQLIDDTTGKILISLSSANKDIKTEVAKAGNVKAAQTCGELFAAKAKAKGYVRVVFDRAGYLYHGRIKAFAEHARKGGLEF